METIQTLVQSFGQRLTLTTVDIDHKASDFETLHAMTDTASDYGVQALFTLPSMTSAALGDVLTLTATSLTRTQTEITNLDTLQQQTVCKVNCKSCRKASNEQVMSVSKEEYWIYPLNKVEHYTYREWHDENQQRQSSYNVTSMLNEATKNVAMNRASFGEGAGRYAFCFFELGQNGSTVVGLPLVVKESCLVLDGGKSRQENFVRSFVEEEGEEEGNDEEDL
eukprot:4207088-Ditylum_brightwellii.AAC.1